MSDNKQSSFRDRPINIDEKGKRKWIYAKQPKGKWYNRRTAFAWLVLTFFIAAPFIHIGGHPFMLLDIGHRQFYIFGQLIITQDTHVLAIVMAVTVVSIVLFTVVFGRFWCGWACPQTIFLEMVYRRIEYLFDGNYRTKKRTKSNESSISLRTILKHLTFFVVTIFFTNVFLMWFIGPHGVYELAATPVQENFKSFGVMMGISVIYYWIYAHFREQVCTMVCPYGRMQGVLIDSKTISVVYDYKRGEPRGSKSEGDCIDCKQCLSVCPTGIDIRNGTQLECVNCTACIDECNIVMQKIKKPGNLIRFDSVEGIEKGKRSLINSRTIGYTSVLIALFGFLLFTILSRPVLDTTTLRLPGTMYQQVSSEEVSNMYNTKIFNKTNSDKTIDIKLITPTGEITVAGKEVFIEASGGFEAILIIKVKTADLSGKSTDIEIGFFEGDVMLQSEKLNFFGPG